MHHSKFIEALGAMPLTSATVDGGRWVIGLEGDKSVTIKQNSHVELLVHCSAQSQMLRLNVERDAELRIVHIVTMAECKSNIDITLSERAHVSMTQVVLSSAEAKVVANLVEPHARFELGGAFILKGEERGVVSADVKHMSADCSSRTTYKGVASDNARGKFTGLVYVAQDAQRTDSEQLSRNVTIGQARIETLPQLEIYADDVKCSHGATVGQMDEQAILYMRQRGLSFADAKRLQIEGFVKDIVLHAAIEECADKLSDLLQEKL